MRIGPAARCRAVALLTLSLLLLFALVSIPAANAIPSGTIETYVGGGNGDGAGAHDATIDPRGLALVGNPNAPDIYVADALNNRVRRVDGGSGLIETIAGNGVAGFGGDGGQGQNASLYLPYDVAVDGAGNAYIADVLNNRVRKVGTDGRISTFAGNGQQTYSGEGIATQESLNSPYGVAVGPDGNVYIADTGNNRIRKVSPPGCAPATCSITSVAGNGTGGSSGDNGPATAATLRNPTDIAFNSSGVMYIADTGNDRIRRVTTPSGTITTVAGGGTSLGDGVPGTQAALGSPAQVAVDTSGNVYIADTDKRRIRMLQAGSFIISTVAGTGVAGAGGDGGLPTQTDLYSTFGVAATTPGNFWLSQSITFQNSPHNRVRKVTNFNVIHSVIGGGLGDGGAALDALVDPSGGEAVNAGGLLPDLYFADKNNVVRYVEGDTATIHTLAGSGAIGYSGDGGPALNAKLNLPTDVARDPSGAIYVADSQNNVIRKIANGTITTAAGDGTWGYNGEGSARQVHLAAPLGIDVDRAGVLYIADTSNNRIRKVSGSQISTVAGNGTWASSGDNGPATSAALRNPTDVVVADDGTLYIADTAGFRIRRVSTAGIITTFAGNGVSGFSGDSGPATLARLYSPTYLSIDSGGNLFIADSLNKRVRRVDAATQTIQTVAGNGQSGNSGDGGAAAAASISSPSGVAVDPTGGTLFIAASNDACVRVVDFDGAPLPTSTRSFTATPIPPPPTNPSTPTRTPTIPTATRTLSPTRTPTSAPASVAVSGVVSYYANNQVRVPGVEVDLSGPQSQTVLTNSSGNYSANNIPVGTWEIEPVKVGSIGSAVSAFDAAKVLQVVSGRDSFNSLQNLACDVTGDGTVSVFDAVQILKLSAGVIEQLPVAATCRSDWLFYPRPDPAQNQSVAVPSISPGNCRPGNILLSPMLTTVRDQDFDGILLGDCTGNWTPSTGGALRLVAPSGVTVHAGALRRAPGKRFRMPIYVQGSATFLALDVKLRIDEHALTLRSARPRGAATGALSSVHSESGSIAISVASAEPIDARTGAVVILEFIGVDGSADDARIQLLSAQVDEHTARLVTHSN